MDLELGGKRVLITGASRGIGKACARAFAAEGADLLLAARDEALLNALAAEIGAAHKVSVSPFPCDLRDSAELDRLAASARDIDILVNNAGDIPPGRIDEIDEASWRHAWNLKVFGYINLTRHMLGHMAARGGGVILNVIGTGGERLSYEYAAGSTGNATLMAFTRAIGGGSFKQGVRVLGVNPGNVLTDRLLIKLRERAIERFGDESRVQEIVDSQPPNSLSMPEEIAEVVVFLASDRARRISGTIVTVDGGMANLNELAA